jgi:hypothetical protein
MKDLVSSLPAAARSSKTTGQENNTILGILRSAFDMTYFLSDRSPLSSGKWGGKLRLIWFGMKEYIFAPQIAELAFKRQQKKSSEV